jgi:Ca2+-binding RTX toxin-like protein
MGDLWGTPGRDVHHGSDESDFLAGYGGDDELYGEGGDDSISGGMGNDELFGGDGRDAVQGDEGNDSLFGGTGDDTMAGFMGDDVLHGQDGNDFLSGQDGADSFHGGGHVSELNHWSEQIGDRVSFFSRVATQGVVADLRTGIVENDGFGTRDTMTGIESLSGSNAHADTYYGNDAANYLHGGFADTLMGFGGDDFFILNGATALLDGGDGIDTIAQFKSAKLEDTDGNGYAETVESYASVTINLNTGVIIDMFGDTGTIANVENICGTYGYDNDKPGDVLIGDAADNVIMAFNGADRIEGGEGSDTISYSDEYKFEHYAWFFAYGAVEVDLAAGYSAEAFQGVLVMEKSSIRNGRDAVSGIENIVGSGLGDRLLGDGGANVITPGAGYDYVSGRGGVDTVVYAKARGAIDLDLAAGFANQQGSDAAPSLMIGSWQPIAADDAEDSRDRLVNIENAIGSALADRLAGADGVNVLSGGGGADVLAGRGGSDILDGGAGLDTADFSDAGAAVTVDLAAGEATTGAAVDQLTSIENATGSAFADRLSGTAGANRLDGLAGADTMSGGLGGDIYVIDDADDAAIETATGGADRVESSISLILGDNLEQLTLIGTADLDGRGNELANLIVGNTGANRLDGKSGADEMRGGAGDDVYKVNDAGDQVVERQSEGADRVEASIDLTLDTDIERLVLIGGGNLHGTGNEGSNRLRGNAGANTLRGLDGGDLLEGGAGNDRLHGGSGDDRLEGGDGQDSFLFETALDGSANVDRILDFAAADDTIRLDRDVFAAIGDGRLAASAFRSGSAATDASDRIVYDQASGKIFYDADGTGDIAAILFARVEAGTALTSADFIGYI